MAQILIVDADIYASELVSVHLEASGHRIATATDGLAALKLLETAAIDVLISEAIVPMRSGFELIRFAFALPADSIPRCFLLTSNMTPAQVMLARTLGVYGVWPKPFSPVQFTEAVNRSLSARPFDLAA